MEKREFTLADLFAMAMKWLWVIVIGMVVTGAGFFYFSKFCITPMYSSTSKFLVQTKNMQQSSQGGSQQLLDETRGITFSQMVVTEYIEVLDTRYFADTLLQYVNGSFGEADSDEKIAHIKSLGTIHGEYDAKMLERMISFKPKEESAAFSVQVTGTNSNDAYVIAKYIEVIMQDYLEQKNPGVGKISVIDGALETRAPINNNVVVNTFLGIIIGAVLAFVVVFIVDINDTRVKDDKELLQVFPIPVIGIIPDCQNTSSSAYPSSSDNDQNRA